MGRPPKLINGTMWQPPAFSLSDRQWLSIERALGKKLSIENRDSIEAITKTYLSNAAAEQSSSKTTDAKGWLTDAAKAARLIEKVFTRTAPAGERDAFHSARAHVYVQLQTILEASGHKGAIPIGDIMTMLPSAIDATIRNRDHLESRLRSPGQSWREWSGELSVYFEGQGLPAGIRKDAGGAAGFVHFLAALQKTFPIKYREHMPDDQDGMLDALAKAAERARNRDV